MSKHQHANADAACRHRLDEWDAVPRDGPAALVVDSGLYDSAGEIRGGWIDLNQPEPSDRDGGAIGCRPRSLGARPLGRVRPDRTRPSNAGRTPRRSRTGEGCPSPAGRLPVSSEHAGGFSPEAMESPVERPEPRVYVASLSDYNAGRLHGAWINANQEPEEIYEGIQAMLATSLEPMAEEWAIHDHDDFGPIALGEYESVEHVAHLAHGIAQHGEAFALWAAHIGGSEWDRLDEFDERYLGEWNSAEDYAANLLEDMGIDITEIGPEILWPYVEVDLAGFARDLSYDIDILDGSSGSVHVFEA